MAFTLIELLVVIAIIAVLALIAIANMQEARIRATVARVRGDFASLETAIAGYAIDWAAYPMGDGVYASIPIELTTPVFYITKAELIDPFAEGQRHRIHGIRESFYTYTEIVTWAVSEERRLAGRPAAPEGIDSPGRNDGAFEKYGAWRLVSKGPDRSYPLPGYQRGDDPSDATGVLWGIDVPYDPTNGTVSKGNIMRTQLDPAGIVLTVPLSVRIRRGLE